MNSYKWADNLLICDIDWFIAMLGVGELINIDIISWSSFTDLTISFAEAYDNLVI